MLLRDSSQYQNWNANILSAFPRDDLEPPVSHSEVLDICIFRSQTLASDPNFYLIAGAPI